MSSDLEVGPALELLFQAGQHREALQLALVTCGSDERFAGALPLLSGLWEIHFGNEAGAGPAGARNHRVTRASLQVASRLRPEARGTLASWEQELVRSVFQ